MTKVKPRTVPRTSRKENLKKEKGHKPEMRRSGNFKIKGKTWKKDEKKEKGKEEEDKPRVAEKKGKTGNNSYTKSNMKN